MDTNRREFLSFAGMAAIAAGTANSAFAADVTGDALSKVEADNIKVVNDFCAAWDTMDPEKLASFWDDKIVFRMIESMPRIEGKAALIEGTKQFLATRKKAHFKVLRTQAMGNIVINERIDYFTRENGEDAFHITGVFLVKGGKIIEWQDYTWPQA